MKYYKILLYFLIILSLVLIGYQITITGQAIRTEKITMLKVIDGDTIDTTIGKIRLLGINTPEKKQKGYEEALVFLKQYEGKEIIIERGRENKDKYKRLLRYVFYNKEMINERILRQGLANLYYYKEDKYTKKLKQAEEKARTNEIGIWKKSKNASCISFVSLFYKEKKGCKNNEQLVIENNCNIMNITLKDDANNIFKKQLQTGKNAFNFSCIFNNDYDSLYLTDSEGMLMFYRY